MTMNTTVEPIQGNRVETTIQIAALLLPIGVMIVVFALLTQSLVSTTLFVSEACDGALAHAATQAVNGFGVPNCWLVP
jgi:hypothetical protein